MTAVYYCVALFDTSYPKEGSYSMAVFPAEIFQIIFDIYLQRLQSIQGGKFQHMKAMDFVDAAFISRDVQFQVRSMRYSKLTIERLDIHFHLSKYYIVKSWRLLPFIEFIKWNDDNSVEFNIQEFVLEIEVKGFRLNIETIDSVLNFSSMKLRFLMVANYDKNWLECNIFVTELLKRVQFDVKCSHYSRKFKDVIDCSVEEVYASDIDRIERGHIRISNKCKHC